MLDPKKIISLLSKRIISCATPAQDPPFLRSSLFPTILTATNQEIWYIDMLRHLFCSYLNIYQGKFHTLIWLWFSNSESLTWSFPILNSQIRYVYRTWGCQYLKTRGSRFYHPLWGTNYIYSISTTNLSFGAIFKPRNECLPFLLLDLVAPLESTPSIVGVQCPCHALHPLPALVLALCLGHS